MKASHPDKPIVILSTDLGGEFGGPHDISRFSKMLDIYGIKLEPSAADAHNQSGKIERSNRTIAEDGRAMMAATGLPKWLWAEAFKYAVHIRNILPNPRIGKSP